MVMRLKGNYTVYESLVSVWYQAGKMKWIGHYPQLVHLPPKPIFLCHVSRQMSKVPQKLTHSHSTSVCWPEASLVDLFACRGGVWWAPLGENSVGHGT